MHQLWRKITQRQVSISPYDTLTGIPFLQHNYSPNLQHTKSVFQNYSYAVHNYVVQSYLETVGLCCFLSELQWPLCIFHKHNIWYESQIQGIISTAFCVLNQATGYASQHIWCLSQARINWHSCSRKGIWYKNGGWGRWKKGKERKSIYIAPFCTKVHTKRSGMDHTVLPANNTMPAFPSRHSPDVTTRATEAADIQLQLTTHLSTPKGWQAELA